MDSFRNKFAAMIAGARGRFEIGYEKELVLQARSKRDGTVFNLMLAPALLSYVKNHGSGFVLKPEYSRCLVEIVTAPSTAANALNLLDELNGRADILETDLQRLVKLRYPRIDFAYEIFLDEQGTSISNLYLDEELRIHAPLQPAELFVLPEYQAFARKHEGHMWSIGIHSERLVDTYNHVNSFHLTFHPTFGERDTFDLYMAALEFTRTTVKRHALLDLGNRQAVRNGRIFETRENIRDLFLRSFLPLAVGHGIWALEHAFNSSGAEEACEILYSQLRATDTLSPLDRLFASWSAFDVRPRLLNEQLPLVEMRRFGSGFSRTEAARSLIQDLISSDHLAFSS